MPASSRPAGRRRAVSSRPRPTSARRPPAPASTGLTTRAAVLGLVLCALVVSAALPLREFLAQRGDIQVEEQRKAAAEQRVTGLEEQLRLLDDPDYVAALARERLHYVKPGETAYVVLAPEQAAAAPEESAAEPAPGADAPWYSQLWGSARAADRPEELLPPPFSEPAGP